MSDFEDRLRSDGAAWREQVDGARPALSPHPARQSRAWVGGLVAAALVLALAVVVLALRHSPTSTSGHIASGGEHASSAPTTSSPAIGTGSPASSTATTPNWAPPRPPSRRVPQQAICPTSGSSANGSGFAVSFAQGTKGEPTMQAAAAKYPPKNVAWSVLAQDKKSALLAYGSHYLHLVRLPGGGWAADSGGDCGGGDATVVK